LDKRDIEHIITDHIRVAEQVLLQSAKIEALSRLCSVVILGGGKILLAGNGGSAADAQHLAAELTGRFEMERPALPAIALTTDTSALTAIGNDYGFNEIFSRQVAALGRDGDVLIVISTSGNSPNLVRAVEVAHVRGVKTIGFLGNTGGVLEKMTDMSFVVPSAITARIQEMHILIGHILCGYIEKNIKQ
jgi:D-sedoheptulose 7-phosphate isomerase